MFQGGCDDLCQETGQDIERGSVPERKSETRMRENDMKVCRKVQK